MKNKVEIKEFLGMEVRVVNNEWIILKDMFNALGRLTEQGQIDTRERNKLNGFLRDIDKVCDRESFTITSKSSKKKSRRTQEVECLRLCEGTKCIITSKSTRE